MGSVVVMNLEYPTWEEPLAAAIFEFGPQELSDRLQRTEEVLAGRIQELRFEENSEHELRLLFDGLAIIRDVRQGRLDPSVGRARSQPRLERTTSKLQQSRLPQSSG